MNAGGFYQRQTELGLVVVEFVPEPWLASLAVELPVRPPDEVSLADFFVRTYSIGFANEPPTPSAGWLSISEETVEPVGEALEDAQPGESFRMRLGAPTPVGRRRPPYRRLSRNERVDLLYGERIYMDPSEVEERARMIDEIAEGLANLPEAPERG